MDIPFVEESCTFTFQGTEYTAGGAVITEDRIIAYPADGGILQDCHGNTIGRWEELSSRPAVFFGHHSWMGSRYYYMRAYLPGGRQYSLRGFGVGMIARGRRIKR